MRSYRSALWRSASTFGAVVAGFGYGLLGVLIGVPLAFAINITRNLTG